MYDERLKVVDAQTVLSLEAGLAANDPSAAWVVWSQAVEWALADAYCLAGGPMPLGGALRLGRGRLVSIRERLGGVQLGRARHYRSDPSEAEDLAGLWCSSLVPILRLRRRLRICIDISASILTKGFTLAKSLELSQQWGKILTDGPVGPFQELEFLGSGGLGDFHAWVISLYNNVVDHIRKVVLHRKDHNIRAWRNWILEDRSAHLSWWLRPDLVPPSPYSFG